MVGWWLEDGGWCGWFQVMDWSFRNSPQQVVSDTPVTVKKQRPPKKRGKQDNQTPGRRERGQITSSHTNRKQWDEYRVWLRWGERGGRGEKGVGVDRECVSLWGSKALTQLHTTQYRIKAVNLHATATTCKYWQRLIHSYAEWDLFLINNHRHLFSTLLYSSCCVIYHGGTICLQTLLESCVTVSQNTCKSENILF